MRISDWSSDVCSSDLTLAQSLSSFSCLGGEGCRHRYLVTGIQPATGDELALAATQIDMLAIDMLRPTMVVAIGEEQEEPLRPDADASVKQDGQQSWPQHRQDLEDRIGMLKAEALRYFRHQLDRGAFRDRSAARSGGQEGVIPCSI